MTCLTMIDLMSIAFRLNTSRMRLILLVVCQGFIAMLDQSLRAAQSIPLNTAEGNSKRSLKDRARFLDIARGSALECAAIQDVLVVSGGLNRELSFELKSQLARIVAMLTRMAMKFDGVSETLDEYTWGVDYEHEHRDAEHEHEEMPDPGVGTKPRKLAC